MPRVVTAITVTELEPDEIRTEPWKVEWTVNGRVWRQTYDAKGMAQQLVTNLLKQIPEGMTKADVLTTNYRSGHQ